MRSLYTVVFVLLCLTGLVYTYQYIQEGFARGGRGGRGIGRGGGIRRGGGLRRGGGYYGGMHYPRRNIFYAPTYYPDYIRPDVYIVPTQDYTYDAPYTSSFIAYLRWLLGYPSVSNYQ